MKRVEMKRAEPGLIFPGVCDKCPVGLVCTAYSFCKSKYLCRCTECKQTLLVFVKGDIVTMLYERNLLVPLHGFPCPLPFAGPRFLCPDCLYKARLGKTKKGATQ